MTINGAVLIAGQECQTDARFHALDPATGTRMDPPFSFAGRAEVDAACVRAAAAFIDFADSEPERRAHFLETIAANLETGSAAIIARAMGETGLPRARLEGELARTAGQLRLFAAVLREGSWADVVIDTALPDRAPLPRPDLRRRHLALGPVAVFGASNFPLAFSVAGGDTASAFAAGCPVVVKGHSAHPGTGELVARAIAGAVAECGLNPGIFSYLLGRGAEVGIALVTDPRIKAVGFTGSRGGGMALVEAANARPEPIPVYAEMSSINPVLLMPHALAARPLALAAGLVQSLCMGAGQFCTNPGLVVALAGPDLDAFADETALLLAGNAAQTMLTPGIHAAYRNGVARLDDQSGVHVIGLGAEATGPNQARAAVFRVDGAAFLDSAALKDEIFGPATIIIAARDLDQVRRIIASLDGQLTATLHFDPADEPDAASLVPLLAAKAGRILGNGWPTGVEVGHAMVHGGPFPATSDTRATSVGALSIERFLRPVCYQNLPDALLPAALRSGNPWNLPRRSY